MTHSLKSPLALLVLFSSAAALTAGAAACGGDDHDGGSTAFNPEGGSLSRPDGGPALTDAGTTEAQAPDAASPADAGGLGAIPIIVETSPTCVANGGTTTIIAADAGGAPVQGYSRLGKVGSRRFLADYDDGLLQTFDLTGGATTTPATLTGYKFGLDSEGTTLGAAWVTGTAVYYGRYDSSGAPMGTAIVAGNVKSADVVAFAGAATGSMVVWGLDIYQRLSAVGINAAGTSIGTGFSFGADTFHTRPQVSVAYDGTDFGVAWSGDSVAGAPTTTSIYFAKVSATGLVGTVNELTTVSRELDVARVVATSAGFAVLVNASLDGTAYVILLGSDGKLAGSAHGFQDRATGWDLAVSGSTIGLVASTYIDGDAGSQLTPVFRPLDLTGKPLSGWVCLGPEASYAGDPVDIAVDGDPNNDFSVVLSNVAGNTALVQFNNLGTLPPQ